MADKPTYAELEQRIRALEKETEDRKQIEKALRESEDRLKEALTLGKMGHWEYGLESGKHTWSDQLYELLDIEKSQGPFEYTEENIVKYFPADWERLIEAFIHAIETGESFRSDYQVRLPSGKTVYNCSTFYPIKDQTGRVTKVRGTVQDITDRKQAEEKLKSTVEYFRLQTELANTFIKLHPSEFGKTIEHFLKRMVELFGVDRAALMYWPEGFASSPVLFIWNKEGTCPYRAPDSYFKYDYLAERLRKGEIFSFSDINELPPEALNEKEYFLTEGIKSAIRIPMIIESRFLGALMLDCCLTQKTWPDDLVQQLQLISQTFSYSLERKLAEEALRESEEKLRVIFENVNDEIIYLDSQGNLLDVNKRVMDIFGFTKEEVIGKNFTEFAFYRSDHLGKIRELFNEALSGSHRNLIELEGRRKDGTEILFEVSTNVIKKDGQIKNFIVVVRDITEKKRLEAQLQQAQRMEAIGTLAGGIAHDFNNLLMGIQGRTSLMLMDTESSHPHFEHLKGIETYVKNAADLTKQLLGFARGGKYEVKPTDLNELIKEQNRMFGRTKKEISIHGKYEKDLWTAEVDRGQIRQVFLNLYVNAWQSMPGGGDLYIQTENVILDKHYIKPFQVEPGKYIKISVTDTGVGMDEATRQRIFDPFFTTKEMGRGTGLGLASAYGIIKNHAGIINAYSEKGLGTTFTIYLPASEKEVKKDKKISDKVLTGKETILLVDDEEIIIDVGKALLKELGYKVLSARSGKEAIEAYETNKDQIALVILDMIMPDMGGGETFDRLKAINPDMKALLSTGYSISGQAAEILERGCNGFIQKPFNMIQLSQKIREVLDKK